MRTIAIALLFTFTLTALGEAQEITAGLSGYTPFGLDDLDGGLPVSAEVRITIPVSRNFAIEPFVTAGPDQARGTGLEGFYGLQIRHVIARFDAAYVFATYGAAGYYSKSGYDG